MVSSTFIFIFTGNARIHDEYLRPAMWIVRVKHDQGKDILILISSFECNELMPILRVSQHATLIMFRPRLSELHSNLLNESKLYVTGQPATEFIDMNDQVQIGVYAGSMYFQSSEEQAEYCSFMGLIPKPRTHPDIQLAYDEGKIIAKGFVPKNFRRYLPIIEQCVGRCQFNDSPVNFAIKLIEARHQSLQKESHVASILQRGTKIEFEQNNRRIKDEPRDGGEDGGGDEHVVDDEMNGNGHDGGDGDIEMNGHDGGDGDIEMNGHSADENSSNEESSSDDDDDDNEDDYEDDDNSDDDDDL